MEFSRIIAQSFDYWKGIPALVAFATGKAVCGFEKDYGDGLKGADVEKELVRTGFGVQAVVITGGEPTQQSDFPIFCKKMRLKNKKVRIRTSGTNPEMLGKLIGRKVVNYIELSLKAPLYADAYHRVCRADFAKVRESVQLVSQSKVEREFSVAWSPELTEQDIMELAGQVGDETFVVEAFAPGECSDASYNSRPATEHGALKGLAQKISGPKEVRIRFGGKEELV